MGLLKDHVWAQAGLSIRRVLVALAQMSDVYSQFRNYVALTKPKIISLLLVTALGGMFLASGGVP